MSRHGPSTAPRVTTVVLALCGMVAALQFTLVIPILPDFPRLMSISPDDASWLITATLLTAAISTPIVSRMADMYGKRRMLLVTLGALVIGSIVCAVVTSFAAMLVGRALQGFASSLIAVGISLLRDQMPPERVSSAVALMSATMGIGSALGLPLSGILVDLFGWHSVFWLTGMAASTLMVGLLVLVRESPLRTPRRFDVGGAVLLSVALLALLLPVSKGATWGWSSPAVLLLVAVGGALLLVWIPLELRVNHPLVDLRTAARRPVLLTNSASLFAGFAMFSNMLVTTQQLQQPEPTGLGMSVLATGLAMVPGGLMMLLLSPVVGRLLDRWGGRRTLLLGVGIMGTSFVGRAFFSGSLGEVIVGSTMVSIGTAISFAAMPTLIMSAVPITETASANGINSLVRSLGTSLGSAVVAMVLTASSAEVAGSTLPTTVGIQVCLWLAVTANVAAFCLTWFIPLERVGGAARKDARAASGETVITGKVVLPNGLPTSTPSIVAVLDLDGLQLDWSRADRDGGYSAVVPGPGRYVLVANTVGWAPAAQVLEIDSEAVGHQLHLSRELTVAGVVTRAGFPCPGAIVALSSMEGEHLGTVSCDEDGNYSFRLPPAGRYLLTAIDAATRSASARKAVLTLHSDVLDIELAGSPHHGDQPAPTGSTEGA